MAQTQCKQEGMCKLFPVLFLVCETINSLLGMKTHLLGWSLRFRWTWMRRGWLLLLLLSAPWLLFLALFFVFCFLFFFFLWGGWLCGEEAGKRVIEPRSCVCVCVCVCVTEREIQGKRGSGRACVKSFWGELPNSSVYKAQCPGRVISSSVSLIRVSQRSWPLPSAQRG